MNPDQIKLEASWKAQLKEEFTAPYMGHLKDFLSDEIAKKKTIYPTGDELFAALDLCPFEQVKVVILGQDPYHGPNQAHGLCFSVKPGVRVPPSLVNIYKELTTDVGFQAPNHGYLKSWAEQGVLLLNSVLSVENGRAGSHAGKGWEQFTDAIIHKLNDERDGVVFVLWGSYAHKKGQFIDRDRHLVIASPHPSPLSAYRGFFGSRPFSKINHYLTSKGDEPIDWTLPQSANH
jgi:uracil-DNA glycosylase